MWTDVCLSGGEIVRVDATGHAMTCVSPGRWWRLTSPWPIGHIRAAARGDLLIVAGQHGETDHAVVVTSDGASTDLGDRAHGVQPIAVRVVDGVLELAWVRTWGHQWRRVRLSPSLNVLETTDFPMPAAAEGTSQGILDWTDATPVFADPGRYADVGGMRYVLPMRRGVYVVGQHPDEDVILAWDGSQHWQVRRGNFQAPPRLAVSGGDACVALLGGVFVPRADWTPYAPPSVRVPTFRPAHRAIGVGLFFDPEGPTIAKANDARFPVSDRTPVVFCDLGSDDIPAAQALARQHGLPLGAYQDHHGYEPARAPRDARAWIQCYPAGSVADTEGAIRRDIAAVVAAGLPFDLVVATYCGFKNPIDGYTWTEQTVLDTLAVAWDLALAHGAGAVWGFARRRGDPLVDGSDYWPGIGEAVQRMRTASENWRTFPRLVGMPAPTPQPIPTPTPIPAPAPSPVPEGDDDMKFSAISKHPILAGFPDEGFVPAEETPHQDAGFVGVRRRDTGKWRFVGEDGKVEDTRDHAGAGEQFTPGAGSTMIATRKGRVYVFAVA